MEPIPTLNPMRSSGVPTYTYHSFGAKCNTAQPARPPAPTPLMIPPATFTYASNVPCNTLFSKSYSIDACADICPLSPALERLPKISSMLLPPLLSPANRPPVADETALSIFFTAATILLVVSFSLSRFRSRPGVTRKALPDKAILLTPPPLKKAISNVTSPLKASGLGCDPTLTTALRPKPALLSGTYTTPEAVLPSSEPIP